MTMPDAITAEAPRMDPEKFKDPYVTAKGERRASVALTHLRTLWFNTGSLCNITCHNCYIDSSPTNDRLAYLSAAEVRRYLDEVDREGYAVEEIAFTGGEPFMNKDLPTMLAEALGRGYRVLVLTNAMKPMWHRREQLKALNRNHAAELAFRVSIDHHTPKKHEAIRGDGTWAPMIEGIRWLATESFKLAVAGRTCWNETEADARDGYRRLFAVEGIPVDVDDPAALVLFPEMDTNVDVPEITVNCWDLLGVEPEMMMCATSRMVIKRRAAESPTVVPCTLLPYDHEFELGTELAGSRKTVRLNHPHCAQFCVLGGASCSPD